ncbi:uncharacterized protein PSFLO_05089 [Pseudozyma flocculosa]|uniref:CCHC-type domain-containing protein n=1 Tax=Pseudozyma flocculosa TaxID=84751 RepID=A0A5C3F541_9BASI|nr:uncharacterized protein PSFLO_05089 [Pseudozyma flocculosa]
MAPPPPRPAAAGAGGHRVARAATRYRPGKAPVAGVDPADLSDSDYDEQDHADASAAAAAATAAGASNTLGQGVAVTSFGPSTTTRKVDLSLKSAQPGQGTDSSEYETDSEQDEPPPRPVFRAPGKSEPQVKQESSSGEYESDSEEGESSEEEEEEEEVKPMLKPVFVSKRQREAQASAPGTDPAAPTAAPGTATTSDASAAAAEAALLARRQESHALAAARIRAELAEKEHQETKPDLDDTDGKDPDAEFQAWRIRELERIKRDREALEEKRREKDEIERRREMPEEERLKEDMERAQKSREDKKRGQQGFMQRYYHKGGFFQDMDILKRDYSAPTESEAIDKTKLPKIMQVRNYGQAKRSKWTHLANEDTSRLAQRSPALGNGSAGGGGGGCFHCGAEGHLKRDCPVLLGGGGGDGGERAGLRSTGTGANSLTDTTIKGRKSGRDLALALARVLHGAQEGRDASTTTTTATATTVEGDIATIGHVTVDTTARGGGTGWMTSADDAGIEMRTTTRTWRRRSGGDGDIVVRPRRLRRGIIGTGSESGIDETRTPTSASANASGNEPR